jgi:membrane-bound lytic murein transglycosylase B
MLLNPGFRLFLTLLLLLATCACVSQAETITAPPGQSPAPSGASATGDKDSAATEQKPEVDAGFAPWLAELTAEALSKGISEATLEDALTDLAPIHRAVKAAETQAENVFTTSQYLARMISEFRIREGARQISEKKALFERVASTYGVQPAYLAALWAIESDFGRGKPRFPLIGALATQAWQGRRQKFFRRELLAALTILDQEQMKSADLRGSWAGASGLFQFMPTSYLHYAVDFNEDGKRNIWTDPEDALASAANFLVKARWQPGQEWGLSISLPDKFDPALAGLKNPKPLQEWRSLGIAEAKGPDEQQASLLLPDGPEGPAFLVFDNFRVLMRWNRSTSFALTIGQLADRIRAVRP